MKPVPDHITASGPAGTVWYGGIVDRSTMTLRVMAKRRGDVVDVARVTGLLGAEANKAAPRHWAFEAPKLDGDLDSQVEAIISALTKSVDIWSALCSEFRVDLFCGLFLERPNRGVTLSAGSMYELGKRGITLGLDIYAPDCVQNQSTDPAA